MYTVNYVQWNIKGTYPSGKIPLIQRILLPTQISTSNPSKRTTQDRNMIVPIVPTSMRIVDKSLVLHYER